MLELTKALTHFHPLSTPESEGDRGVAVLAETVDTVICLASEEGSGGGRRRL